MSAQSDQVPHLPLSANERIPQLGFGVFLVPPRETEEVVANALSAGYRHLDTAAAYRNEGAVGEAIHASGLDRGEIFITTKCWNDDHGYEQAKRACRASLERLELELPRPVPDPLAGAGPRSVCGDVEGLHRAAVRGPGPLDRRLELPAGAPASA